MQRWISWAALALALFAFYLYVRPPEPSENHLPKQLPEVPEQVPVTREHPKQNKQAEPKLPLAAPKHQEQETLAEPPLHTAQTAKKPGFTLPLDCNFGENCWVARYSDRNPSSDKADYMCGRRTQNNHKGTDFAIANYGIMQRGISVLAVDAGKVLRTRDTMQDISVQITGRKAIKGKECGNAAFIQHANGITTQYCHMRKGSLTVKPGDKVARGQKIGLLGLSGDTEYPHLHLNVRKDKKRIDPFDGQKLSTVCSQSANDSLWENAPAYTQMDLLPLVFSSEPLTRRTRWQEQPVRLQTNTPALILTGIAWNVLAGDRWQFTIMRPDGTRATSQRLTAKENRQSQWYANRLFRPVDGFMPGVWKGKLTVTRQDTSGTTSRFERETEILVAH